MIIDILTLFPTFYESPISVGIINNAIKNKKIKELSQKEHITMILGHYEGIDYRVEKKFADEIISIGDYVLSGGEIPALLLIDAISRYKDILNNKEKVDIYFDERPVWIQGVNNRIAKVGFVDNFEERDVFIEDLYERNLYN